MKSKYRGILNEPIVSAGLFGFPNGDDWVKDQFILRLSALFDHYGVERTGTGGVPGERDYLQLIVKLAADHVPGFKVAKVRPRVGRKREWDAVRYWKLLLDIKSLSGRGFSARSACSRLLKSYDTKTLDTLYRRYQEARSSPLARVLRDAAAFDVAVEIGLVSKDGDQRAVDALNLSPAQAAAFHDLGVARLKEDGMWPTEH